MNRSICAYIRDKRNELGLTLTQMGARLEIDSGALSKIETGKKVLDPKLIPLIAEVFGDDPNWLKEEYASERIAYLIIEEGCSDNSLQLAEEKLKYFRSKFSRSIRNIR
jgi:transcriptional regulator with XRE-family HTH domain